MTREEAAEQLRNLAVKGMRNGKQMLSEAINLAICALKVPEIIRCKDCIYFEYADYLKKEKGKVCTNRLNTMIGDSFMFHQDDHFCSYAEKILNEEKY